MRALSRLAVACTREHDWSVPEPLAVELARSLPPERVVAAATYHRVVGCVLASLRGGAGVPRDTVLGLEAASRRAVGYSTLARTTLRTLGPLLDDDVAWLAFKGPVLDVAYPRERLRSYRDVDVLVPASGLRDAVERLEGAGWTLADRNWRLILDTMAGEVHLQREGCGPLDLHWTLVFDEHLRETFRFDLDGMIARSRTVDVGGTEVRTFDPADTLLHLSVHASLEGGGRLVWLKDIDIAARGVDRWDDVIDRAHAYGVALPVSTLLDRAVRALGTPIPHDVRASLAPRRWRALTCVADGLFPVSSSDDVGNPATLLARSARRTPHASLGLAVTGIARRTRLLAAGQLRKVDRRADPTHEASLNHPSGGAREREAFFAAVSARPSAPSIGAEAVNGTMRPGSAR